MRTKWASGPSARAMQPSASNNEQSQNRFMGPILRHLRFLATRLRRGLFQARSRGLTVAASVRMRADIHFAQESARMLTPRAGAGAGAGARKWLWTLTPGIPIQIAINRSVVSENPQ